MKASRFLLLCLMTASCLPASGVSPARTVIANPDPQLSGPAPSSPFVVREAAERSAGETAASAAASGKKKMWPWIVAGVAAAVLVIVLISSGGGYDTPSGY